MKNKTILITSIISVISALLLITVVFLLIHNYKAKKAIEVLETYGIVKHVYADSIVIEETNTNREITYIKDNNEDFNEGDLIFVKTKDNKIESYQVVVDDYKDIIKTTEVVTSSTTTTTTTTTSTTTTSSAKVIATTPTTTTTFNIDKDYIIYNHMKTEQERIDKISIKDKAKEAFVSIVDFIFYDEPIKGVRFSELKADTKAKVVYYALLIDSGIDSKFPGYKETLSSKYQDIKGRLLAEYLDLKYEVCNKYPSACNQAKEDLEILKKSMHLTWNVVKEVFKYIKDLSVPKIKSWYESFRG